MKLIRDKHEATTFITGLLVPIELIVVLVVAGVILAIVFGSIHFSSNYTESDWNKKLIEDFKPLITNIDNITPENCYSRITIDGNETVITYFFYWSYQNFSIFSHEDDWEPIFVYLKDGVVDRVAYDMWHYRVGRNTTPVTYNNHVLIKFIDNYRAISTVSSAENYSAGLEYNVSYLDKAIREIIIDFGFKKEILDKPIILWYEWIPKTEIYIYNDMWDRKEKFDLGGR